MSRFRLHSHRVHADTLRAGEEPSGWILFLHGILGSGNNWATFARSLVAENPRLGCCLVDHREHGKSLGADPPHTISRCVEDLLELESSLPGPVVGVSGHSFGSKVAILYAEARRLRGQPLDRLWVLDGDPAASSTESSQPEGSVEWVLAQLEALPAIFERRSDFVSQLEDRGVQPPVAAWLGSNVREESGEYRFRLNLTSIRALLTDYRRTNAWPALESETAAVRCVLGGRSDAVSIESQERFRLLGESRPSAECLLLPTAGHWVHVDAPRELMAVFN